MTSKEERTSRVETLNIDERTRRFETASRVETVSRVETACGVERTSRIVRTTLMSYKPVTRYINLIALSLFRQYETPPKLLSYFINMKCHLSFYLI